MQSDTLVKVVRTGVQILQVQNALEGEIDDFV
jgi:hypothetical protein